MTNVEDARRRIRDFRESVIAVIVLKNHFESYSKSTSFNFGANLKQDGSVEGTPDLFIRGEFGDLIGELKKSVPNPPKKQDGESISEYQSSKRYRNFVKIIDEKIGDQISSYNENYEDVKDGQEVFLLFNERYDEGVNVWYDEEGPKDEESFIGISFRESPSKEGEKEMSIKLFRDTEFDYGELNDFFRVEVNDWKYADAPEIISKNNIALVEEKDEVPMPYLMLILWQNIFEELKEGETNDKVLERLKRDDSGHDYVIEADIDTIQNHLDTKYTLNFFDEREHAQTERGQFKRTLVREAMRKFEKIELTEVEKIDENPEKYRIVYEELSGRQKDAIGALIEALDEKNLLDKSELHGRGFDEMMTKQDATS